MDGEGNLQFLEEGEMKKMIFFTLAVVISLIGATYRWGDFAHSIGLIRTGGGEVKHPPLFKNGRGSYILRGSYTLLVTATVISPYRGDVKVVLEGEPKIASRLYLSSPVVDLGLKRCPHLKGDTLYDLDPGDRIALWVLMNHDNIMGKYNLAFYDAETKRSVLNVPIIFKGKGDAKDAGKHHS